MPLITGEEIARLVELFEQRNVKFYHACQYKDFKSYLHLGGVPSRELLNQRRLNYTRFDTDNRDQTNAVWSKVFGNLSDFGAPFFSADDNTASVPPPYGPILLVFNPRVFMQANDVAICLRSAGGLNFDRARESLGSANDVNNIFRHVDINSMVNPRERSYIKYNSELQQTFGLSNASSPEVSCSTNTGVLSFDELSDIKVDPYVLENTSLVQLVSNLANRSNLNANINERYMRTDRKGEFISIMANLLSESEITVNDILNNMLLPEFMRDYAIRIQTHAYQFNRFARYLREGTILEVLADL